MTRLSVFIACSLDGYIATLDDSLDFSYGQPKMDLEQYSAVLENEKKNFRLLICKVCRFYRFTGCWQL